MSSRFRAMCVAMAMGTGLTARAQTPTTEVPPAADPASETPPTDTATETPVEPAPEPAPVEPAPAEPAPVEPPIVAAPFEPAPAPAPAEPAPLSTRGDPPDSAWEALTRMPPRSAWDAGLHVSLGNIGYWREETPPWVGFGLRGGWGRVFGVHRVGVGAAFSVEGPIPLYWSALLEPAAIWDAVILGGLALGASVGPAAMLHMELETTGTKTVFGVAPSAAFRIGYSEPWSRVGRRFFVHAEPKVRWIRDGIDWSVALVIGSGSGR